MALCGCMMQEPGTIEKIQKSYRFVDLIFGTHNTVSYTHLDVYKRQGYAGGITSAAMDGMRVAEAIAARYQIFQKNERKTLLRGGNDGTVSE